MKDKRKQRRAGYYWVDGKPYPSVTTILNAVNKGSGLIYWFGKQVYLAMAKDPTISEKEALAAPYKKSGKAMSRGSAVHSIIEAYRPGFTTDNLPADLRGYANAFLSWVEDNNPEIILREKTVVSKKHGFAGTLDLLAKLNEKSEPILVDIKTGKGIYPESFLQLSAYKNALLEESAEAKVGGMAVLLLKENGNYVFERGEDVFDVFLATKKLWEWKNKKP